ncbi:MAG: hypothetical protein L0221_19020, partial [Chloroflexi bacterium]|nr:hypothetical protein [Chloroflexota bacterium]
AVQAAHGAAVARPDGSEGFGDAVAGLVRHAADGERAIGIREVFASPRSRYGPAIVILSTGETRALPASHRDYVDDLAVDPRGEILVTGSLDGTIRFWDLSAVTELASLDGHGMGIAVAFTSDGHYLITAGADQVLAVRVATTGEIVARFVAPAAIRSLRAARRRIVMGDAAGRVYFFDLRAGDLEPVTVANVRRAAPEPPALRPVAATTAPTPEPSSRPWWRIWR